MSKKSYLIGAIVFIVVIIFILAGGSDKTEPDGGDVATKDNSVTVTLTSQNESGISGTAILSETEGKTKVVLNLIGGPTEGSHPAHIHMGTCVNLGGVKYPLTNAVGGSSETLLDVSMADLKGAGSLLVNVHKSESESSTYVACGEIPGTASE